MENFWSNKGTNQSSITPTKVSIDWDNDELTVEKSPSFSYLNNDESKDESFQLERRSLKFIKKWEEK